MYCRFQGRFIPHATSSPWKLRQDAFIFEPFLHYENLHRQRYIYLMKLFVLWRPPPVSYSIHIVFTALSTKQPSLPSECLIISSHSLRAAESHYTRPAPNHPSAAVAMVTWGTISVVRQVGLWMESTFFFFDRKGELCLAESYRNCFITPGL